MTSMIIYCWVLTDSALQSRATGCELQPSSELFLVRLRANFSPLSLSCGSPLSPQQA